MQSFGQIVTLYILILKITRVDLIVTNLVPIDKNNTIDEVNENKIVKVKINTRAAKFKHKNISKNSIKLI